MPYAAAVGEMFDAVDFFGPFQEFDDAEAWADRNAGGGNWWVVSLEPHSEEGLATLVIDRVEMGILQQQYTRLQEVIAFVEDARRGMGEDDIPDASILDGLVEMLGDALPLPSETDDDSCSPAPTEVE